MAESDPPARSHHFSDLFRRGAELADELLRENAALRNELEQLRFEHDALRSERLASSPHDLLGKLAELEKEKRRLNASWTEAETVAHRFGERFRELEGELSVMSHLYVAAHQLHATLKPSLVFRNIKELFVQLVGARSLALYMADASKVLQPVLCYGVGGNRLSSVRPSGEEPESVGAAIWDVFSTRKPRVKYKHLTECSLQKPAAILPLSVEDRAMGVAVVFAVLPQKSEFGRVDEELFHLLAAHAGVALVSAQLFETAGEALPAFDPVHDGGVA